MRLIKIFSVIVCVCGVVAAYVYFFRPSAEDLPAPAFIENDFEAEVVTAIDNFYEGGAADVISGVNTSENVLAITFADLSDTEVAHYALDVVKRYGINCTFFFQGREAAEYPRIISDIQNTENEVGSFSLFGHKYLNERMAYDLIEDFVYSAMLIERAGNSRPQYLMCNNTRYTENLLKSAYASGFEYVIEATHILNFQSFSSYESTYNYVRNLPNGSVIEIKMQGVLDGEEFFLPEKAQDVGKDPNLDENELFNEKQRLMHVVEWVCKAISETERKTVFLSELPSLPPAEVLSAEVSGAPALNPVGASPATASVTDHVTASENIQPVQQAADIYVPVKTANSLPTYFSGIFVAENNGQLAEPLQITPLPERAFSYNFYGINNENALNDTLNRLANLHITATFFVSLEDISSYPDRVKKIADSGHSLGIALLPKHSATSVAASEMLQSIKSSLSSGYGVKATLVAVPFGEVTGIMRTAVSAANMKLVTFDTVVVRSADEFATNSDKIFANLLGNSSAALKYGSSLYFRLDFYKKSDALVGGLLEKFAQLEDSLLSLDTRVANNAGRMVTPVSPVHTTEKALSFVFYGIENSNVLFNVISNMKTINGKGTFFVTEQDIISHKESVLDILAAGHEIGVALQQRDGWSVYDALSVLISARNSLALQYNVYPQVVMLPFGTANNATKEAVSALNMTLIQPNVTVVSNADEFATSAESVIESRFGDSPTPLKRGDIVYFRLNFYKNSNTLVGELIGKVKEKLIDPIKYPYDYSGDSAYAIKTVGSLLGNSGLLYQYPLPDDAIPAEMIGAISPGKLDGMTDNEIFSIMKNHYIGNPDVSSVNSLPGFSTQQMESINTTGRIDTKDKKVVFLTFDDWGNDVQLNHLLYVLKKYNVKATFFCRTQYIFANPNLLRAIAQEGHDIGSHTVNHLALANYDAQRGIYTSISTNEAVTLQTELVESYNTLISIAGDVKNEQGQSAVQRYFRAPTLAQSYIGMKTVFDCGYQYSISGDFSSGDYSANNPKQVRNILQNGLSISDLINKRTIGNGSIVVMHMSPSSPYTAEGLDLYLTDNANKPAGEQFTFARLSDFL